MHTESLLQETDRAPKCPARADVRRFAWITPLGFIVLGVLLWTAGRQPESWGWTGSVRHWFAIIFWIVAPVVPAVCLFSESGGRVLYTGWMGFSRRMGSVMTAVLMSILYFVLLPAFALIVRLKDPLRRRLSEAPSYWEEHAAQEATLDRLRRPF